MRFFESDVMKVMETRRSIDNYLKIEIRLFLSALRYLAISGISIFRQKCENKN